MNYSNIQYDISVIVPIYNADKYLEKCITSIVQQTKKNIEIVLVNDGSTDNSPRIIDRFAKAYSNIQVVSQENQGLSGARISGFKVAHGKYIGWVDADDFINPTMYEKLYNLAEKDSCDLVYCNYECYPHKVATKTKWFKKYEGKKDWRFIDHNTTFWNKLFLKSLLEKVDLVSLLEKYGDYSPILPMIIAQRIEYIDENLYYYRVGHESMSGGSYKGKTDHFIGCCKVTKTLPKMIENTEYKDSLAEYFRYRYIYTLLTLMLVAAVNSDRAEYIMAKKELQDIDYRKNTLTNTIVTSNYGRAKGFVISEVVPLNYSICRALAAFL